MVPKRKQIRRISRGWTYGSITSLLLDTMKMTFGGDTNRRSNVTPNAPIEPGPSRWNASRDYVTGGRELAPSMLKVYTRAGV
jgi:hypothetical protein